MSPHTIFTKETQRALVLLAHGARNADWAKPFLHVQRSVQSQRPDVAVKLAFLEFMSPDLPTAVRQLAQQGRDDITVVPLFLGQSGHVLRDVPPMIAHLQQEFPAISLRIANAAGEDAGVLEAMAVYCLSMLASGQ
jgi:sirohydrochlorin cobaltochelatase